MHPGSTMVTDTARSTRWSRLARCGVPVATLAAVLALGLTTTSCGGGGSFAAKPMVLVEFLFVDRSLTPSFPTGVQALPRNAQIVFQFSELVNPASVNEQTIAIRFGAQFQSVPKGSFQVDGSRVIFDPTVTVGGQPNPFGLQAVTQYNIELPAAGQTNDVIENLDNDPLLAPFLTHFVTSDGFLRELVPPEVLDLTFIPAPDPVSKQIPGNGVMAIHFSEPIDPATMILSVSTPAPTLSDNVDIRYSDITPNPNVNFNDGMENVPIPGSFTFNPGADTYYFKPTFSFGTKKYVFTVSVFQGITDLAGNLLVNPRSFGPFTNDGTGIQNGRILAESFDTTNDDDAGATTADWGATEAGVLLGAAISTRRARITGSMQAVDTQAGQYNPIVDPLIGADLNTYVANINPPTILGRRVMWAFKDIEMGANGSITACQWGPDSNATFAAKYPDVILRIGFQKTASMSLAATFSGNYLASPLVIYKGEYNVSQSANVGNEAAWVTGEQFVPVYIPPQYTSGNDYRPDIQQISNVTNSGQMAPLFNYWGWVDWPAPSSYFDWDNGDPAMLGDAVLIFDASVQEGDSWNQIRGWYAVTYPNSGILLGGYPTRRMYATYEEDVPNPSSNFIAGIINPEPSLTDTAFTITTRKSVAQSRFYTPAPGDPALNPAGPPPPPFSSQWTFSVKSDYQTAQILPSVQQGGAQILLEFQGAIALDSTGNRNLVNAAFPSTAFTNNINDCDTFPYIRWRMTMFSNLISNKTARVTSISIPILQYP